MHSSRRRLHDLSATIVLVNNDGGGIFSFLPQASAAIPAAGLPDRYEELFGTPHGIDVAPIVTALGGEHVRVGPGDLQTEVERSIGVCRSPGAGAANGPCAERRAPSGGRRDRRRGDPALSAVHVDGLRWEVRVRGAGTAAAAAPRLHRARHELGRARDRLRRAFRVVVVDLPGHGRTGVAARPASYERRAHRGRPGRDPPPARRRPADVVGYSLGARIALRLAVAHPDVVGRLVLESPSAGIEDSHDRAARRAADEAMAEGIERDGIEAFVAAWEAQPIFASQSALPAARAARIRAIRLANRPDGLAASLRGAGQGAMEPLVDRLGEVRAPTLVIAGALDDRGPTPRRVQSPPASPAPGWRSSTGQATPPTTSGPPASDASPSNFLQEDAA